MNTVQGWILKPTAAAAIALLLVIFPGLAAHAQSGEKQDQGFRSVEELRRLIEVAKESGFSQAQLREITIEDQNGKIINVWDYLQEIERKQKAAAAREKAEREKVYLTVQDVFAEIKKGEPEDLTRLREEIPVN